MEYSYPGRGRKLFICHGRTVDYCSVQGSIDDCREEVCSNDLPSTSYRYKVGKGDKADKI